MFADSLNSTVSEKILHDESLPSSSSSLPHEQVTTLSNAEHSVPVVMESVNVSVNAEVVTTNHPETASDNEAIETRQEVASESFAINIASSTTSDTAIEEEEEEGEEVHTAEIPKSDDLV
jgi:hypothetical protein